jgi:CRISPR-associated protein Cas5d
MAADRSPILKVRVRGPLACFTRPELKVERVSYPVMTPSAARGVLEAVLWKPAVQWHIKRIHVLNEIRFAAFRRNEVNTKAAAPSQSTIREGGAVGAYYADDDRAQRNTVALRDVDYVVEAYLTLTPRAGEGDSMTKFVEMFERRVAKGQHFHQPYLGCRELIAEVMPVAGALTAQPLDQDLGIMLWDIEFGPTRNTPRFFAAKLERGVLHVPEDPEATLPGGGAS